MKKSDTQLGGCMFLMIEGRKLSYSGKLPVVKGETGQFEPVDIAVQHFSGKRVQGPPLAARQGGGVILKIRITEGTPGIHDTRLPLSPDIQEFGMIQAQRMSIFVGCCRGGPLQVRQLEIPRIRSQPVHKRNVVLGEFFYSEKIITGIGIMPDGCRGKVWRIDAFYIEGYFIPFLSELHPAMGFAPMQGDLIGNPDSQVLFSRLPVKIDCRTYDQPVIARKEFRLAHTLV